MRPEAHQTWLEGRYQLVRELGAGGMGAVFEAYDNRLEVKRAIKFLDHGLSPSKSLKSRCEAEARIMAKLAHPNIVAVHDVVMVGETLFIVMELVEGGSLADRVEKHGPLAPGLACKTLDGLLGALQVAHDAGVIHRDVKPHNVLLTPQGVPKLTDFGIAQQARDGKFATRTGAMMGTPAYMAPEQRLDAKRVGPPADVYAAGATLFAVVTGGDPYDLYDRRITQPLLEGVPAPLRAVILRASEFDPEKRYASAREMQEALALAARDLDRDPNDAVPLVLAVEPPDPKGTKVPSPTFNHSLLGFTATELVVPTPTAVPPRPPPPVQTVRWGVYLLGAGALLATGSAAVGLGWWAVGQGSGPGPDEPEMQLPPEFLEFPPAETAAAPDTAVPEAGIVPPADGPKSPILPKPTPNEGSETVPPPAEIRVEPETSTSPSVVTLPTPIRAQPRAEVWVGGALRGTTPLVLDLPEGTHQVRLQPVNSADGAPVERTIVVRGGRENGLCWDFRRGSVCTP